MTDPQRAVPAEGEAIVVDGKKYRVRELGPAGLVIAPAGPNWRKARTRTLPPGTLTNWDRDAAAWRT